MQSSCRFFFFLNFLEAFHISITAGQQVIKEEVCWDEMISIKTKKSVQMLKSKKCYVIRFNSLQHVFIEMHFSQAAVYCIVVVNYSWEKRWTKWTNTNHKLKPQNNKNWVQNLLKVEWAAFMGSDWFLFVLHLTLNILWIYLRRLRQPLKLSSVYSVNVKCVWSSCGLSQTALLPSFCECVCVRISVCVLPDINTYIFILLLPLSSTCVLSGELRFC